DTRVQKARKKMRRACRAVADDDDVRVQRLEIAGRVLGRLAFLERRSFGCEIDDISGQPKRSELKTDAGACRRLDEKIDDGFAAQGRDFFYGSFADGFKRPRRVEHGGDFIGAERFDV